MRSLVTRHVVLEVNRRPTLTFASSFSREEGALSAVADAWKRIRLAEQVARSIACRARACRLLDAPIDPRGWNSRFQWFDQQILVVHWMDQQFVGFPDF